MLHFRSNQRRNWTLPLAAALGLLALLGASGENTDIGAHLFGFISGIWLGLLSEFLTQKIEHPWRRIDQWMAILTASLVLGAWGLASMVGR